MSLGPGLIRGQPTDLLVDISPGATAYVDDQGAVFHPQDEGGSGDTAYYEIQNTGDQIDFRVTRYMERLDNPFLVLYTSWGATDFQLIDRQDGAIQIDEFSGFDATGWIVNLAGTSGALRLTQFDTGTTSGTEAAWRPYVGMFALQ